MTDIRNSGIVTITFDDALLSQFENGFPILSRHGAHGVVFVPTGLVGGHFSGEPMMNLYHLKQLAMAGWEIGSHTVTHNRLAGRDGATRLPVDAIDGEVRESREWLIDHGFPASSFAYPHGRYNQQVEAIVGRYYQFVRTTENGLNEISLQTRRLKTFDLCQRKLDMWRPAVDAARTSSKWLVAMIHGIRWEGGNGEGKFQITTDALATSLEYALAVGLQVLTFREVWEALTNTFSSLEVS